MSLLPLFSKWKCFPPGFTLVHSHVPQIRQNDILIPHTTEVTIRSKIESLKYHLAVETDLFCTLSQSRHFIFVLVLEELVFCSGLGLDSLRKLKLCSWRNSCRSLTITQRPQSGLDWATCPLSLSTVILYSVDHLHYPAPSHLCCCFNTSTHLFLVLHATVLR